MTKRTVLARITALPGRRDDLAAAFGAVVDAARAEAGTELYRMHLDRKNPDVLWFYEEYSSKDAMIAHMQSDVLAGVTTQTQDLLAGEPEMHFLEVVGDAG
jgi:quinol monooxygenase YgiN